MTMMGTGLLSFAQQQISSSSASVVGGRSLPLRSSSKLVQRRRRRQERSLSIFFLFCLRSFSSLHSHHHHHHVVVCVSVCPLVCVCSFLDSCDDSSSWLSLLQECSITFFFFQVRVPSSWNLEAEGKNSSNSSDCVCCKPNLQPTWRRRHRNNGDNNNNNSSSSSNRR